MTQNKAFISLSKKKRKIVKLLFEDELTDQEIADTVSCSRSTIARLKQDPIFIQAQQEYAISVLDRALPDSVRELLKLIHNSKSEMVKLQAIQTVFKRAGLFSDNGTPELDKARIRKANADADVSEAKAKQLKEGTSLDGVTIQFVRSDREEEKDSENDQS